MTLPLAPGQTFRNLTTVRLISEKSGQGRLWLCACACGNTREVPEYRLRGKYVRSCGCLGHGIAPPVYTKHGMYHYSGFKVWESMMRRCFNSLDKDFAHYGGRGITVCARWMDPRNFGLDMGEKPLNHSLDRIDVNGNYCPENCRWATAMQQGANKRSNRFFEIQGETYHISEWCRKFNISLSTVINRLKEGMDPHTALTLPSMRPRRCKAAS